jgi:hypothetical protein
MHYCRHCNSIVLERCEPIHTTVFVCIEIVSIVPQADAKPLVADLQSPPTAISEPGQFAETDFWMGR